MKTASNQRRRRVALVAACLPVLFVVAACSGSSGSPGASHAPGTASTPTTGTGGGNSGGPNPNATETPPPGDIPDNQAFVPYSPADHAYSIKVPEGWAMTQVGQATLFTDKFNSIRVEKLTAAAAPTTGSATARELPAIKLAAHGFVAGTVTSVPRPAGSAIKITYRADSAPNPVTDKVVVQAVERYEFWRSGTEIVLTLSAAVGSDNVDPWRKVTDSFAWHA